MVGEKIYFLEYEHCGNHRKFSYPTLIEFMQELERVEGDDYIPNSTIDFYTKTSVPKREVYVDPLSKLYKDFSMFHESVEDFIERMEADNGTNWIAKFTTQN